LKNNWTKSELAPWK